MTLLFQKCRLGDDSPRKGNAIFGPRDCMGWSPPLQGGNSGGFDSHEVHQEFIPGLFFGSCAFDDENA